MYCYLVVVIYLHIVNTKVLFKEVYLRKISKGNPRSGSSIVGGQVFLSLVKLNILNTLISGLQ